MTRSLMRGKGFHGHDGDGLILGEIVHARFAGEARAAVDFRGAGAALPCFAIPADGEIGRDVPLNVVQRVEHDHAGSDGHLVVDGWPPPFDVAAEDSQDGLRRGDFCLLSRHFPPLQY